MGDAFTAVTLVCHVLQLAQKLHTLRPAPEKPHVFDNGPGSSMKAWEGLRKVVEEIIHSDVDGRLRHLARECQNAAHECHGKVGSASKKRGKGSVLLKSFGLFRKSQVPSGWSTARRLEDLIEDIAHYITSEGFSSVKNETQIRALDLKTLLGERRLTQQALAKLNSIANESRATMGSHIQVALGRIIERIHHMEKFNAHLGCLRALYSPEIELFVHEPEDQPRTGDKSDDRDTCSRNANLIRCKYTFRQNGTPLQRSMTGLPRSLLFQIIIQDPEMTDRAFPGHYTHRTIATMSQSESECEFSRGVLMKAIARVMTVYKQKVGEVQICVDVECSRDSNGFKEEIKEQEVMDMKMN